MSKKDMKDLEERALRDKITEAGMVVGIVAGTLYAGLTGDPDGFTLKDTLNSYLEYVPKGFGIGVTLGYGFGTLGMYARKIVNSIRKK